MNLYLKTFNICQIKKQFPENQDCSSRRYCASEQNKKTKGSFQLFFKFISVKPQEQALAFIQTLKAPAALFLQYK